MDGCGRSRLDFGPVRLVFPAHRGDMSMLPECKRGRGRNPPPAATEEPPGTLPRRPADAASVCLLMAQGDRRPIGVIRQVVTPYPNLTRALLNGVVPGLHVVAVANCLGRTRAHRPGGLRRRCGGAVRSGLRSFVPAMMSDRVMPVSVGGGLPQGPARGMMRPSRDLSGLRAGCSRVRLTDRRTRPAARCRCSGLGGR